MNPDKELYFSIDLETSGPYPFDYQIMSIGCAAFDDRGNEVATFYANMHKELIMHPDTAEFWAKNDAAYEQTRFIPREPEIVIPEFVQWVKDICKKYKGKACCVAYPAGFDFMFLYPYICKYGPDGNSPFSFSCIDIKTMAMVGLQSTYRGSRKSNWPNRWKAAKVKHSHNALDDAREQGEMFFLIRKDLYGS